MSNLSAALKLAPADTQLPVGVYFDEALHQQELELLFRNGPGYIGHELMVPEVGDFLAVMDAGKIQMYFLHDWSEDNDGCTCVLIRDDIQL